MKSETSKSYLTMHIAVLLFGFTAILGDLIQLNAFWLVWWRILLASLGLILIIGLTKFLQANRSYFIQYVGIGALVTGHWISFYGSIKLSNASLAVVCLATTSFMTAILEPIIRRTKFQWIDLLMGLAIIPGMVLIVKGSPEGFYSGIVVGLISAFLASLFAILNKRIIHTNDARVISFVELFSAWLLLSLLSPIVIYFLPEADVLPPNVSDWIYMLILAFLCTTLAYYLSLKALHHLSAFAANLTINLEPVYGVILAYFLLGDGSDLNDNFYIGTIIIVVTVFMYPLIRLGIKRRNRKQNA